MYFLYKKNELIFALIWIIAYIFFMSLADGISNSIGIRNIITVPVCAVFVILILGFIKRHNLLRKYGLCLFKGNLKDYLYFIPLFFIAGVNLWNGIEVNSSVAEIFLFVLSMSGVGIIEEIVFRGFLFKALCKDNIKLAIYVSSISFGIGHIVNLLNGKDLTDTLLQILYATAIGFLFTIIFYKGKSLLPCIITHAVFNSLSIFDINNSSFVYDVVTAVILCIVPILYALWILKNVLTDMKTN